MFNEVNFSIPYSHFEKKTFNSVVTQEKEIYEPDESFPWMVANELE